MEKQVQSEPEENKRYGTPAQSRLASGSVPKWCRDDGYRCGAGGDRQQFRSPVDFVARGRHIVTAAAAAASERSNGHHGSAAAVDSTGAVRVPNGGQKFEHTLHRCNTGE